MGILPRCFGGSASAKQPSTTIEHLCARFSLAQLQKSTNNFHSSQLLRIEPFGEAYRGFITINGEAKEIAVKRVRDGRFTPRLLSMFKNEIILMCQLQHPNLVSLIGFCYESKSEIMMVYECMPNGSLRHQLVPRDGKSPILSWKRRLEISIGAARGLHYLHSGTKRTIFHRAVSTNSILLDENWVPKITGFDLAVKGPKFSSKALEPIEFDTIVGTSTLLAPEYAWHGKFTDKSDVYSFGAVLLELVCGKMSSQILSEIFRKGGEDDYENVNGGEHTLPSFWDIVQLENAKKIIDPCLVGEITPECWKLYIHIVEICLNEDASERPAMGEVEVELERALELQEEASDNHQIHAISLP